MRGSRLANPSRHSPYGSIVPRITQDPARSCTLQSRRFRSCVSPDFGFLAPSLLATDTLLGLRRDTVLSESFHADFYRTHFAADTNYVCTIILDIRTVCPNRLISPSESFSPRTPAIKKRVTNKNIKYKQIYLIKDILPRYNETYIFIYIIYIMHQPVAIPLFLNIYFIDLFRTFFYLLLEFKKEVTKKFEFQFQPVLF